MSDSYWTNRLAAFASRYGFPHVAAYDAHGNLAAGSTSTTPVIRFEARFQDKKLGEIRVALGKSAEQKSLNSAVIELAAQWACYLNTPNKAFAANVDELVSNLHKTQPGKFAWTGVYVLTGPDTLELAAFRGEPSPHMRIPVNRGICGAAVREKATLNIADVNADSRYLSCSIKTKSEIVVPIYKNGGVVGEIDIDSHVKNAFTKADEVFLQNYAEKFSELFE